MQDVCRRSRGTTGGARSGGNDGSEDGHGIEGEGEMGRRKTETREIESCEAGCAELELCREDFRYFAEKYLMIVDRERRLVPLELNPIQARYHAGRTACDIILKARKVGITTYKCAEYFHDTIFRPNTITTIIAHNLDTTVEIFEKVKLFHDRLPPFLKPKVSRSNRRELVFTHSADGGELNSKYSVGTAGNVEFGRGKDIDNLHLSEYAFYRDAERIRMGAMQALRTGGKVSIESTANGFNDFHDQWERAKAGDSIFKAHFFAWYEDPGCVMPASAGMRFSKIERECMAAYGVTPSQIAWYRWKRRQLGEMVSQEYPFNDAEAFLSSMRCVFDMEALGALMRDLHGVEPVRVTENGALKVWAEPVNGRFYTAGADCSEGVQGGDFSCCIVVDRESCEQVAELHGRWPADVFAAKCKELCESYNNALLAVERNNHGHTVLHVLRNRLGYGYLYRYRDYDAKKDAAKLGWDTNLKSKPIMIDDLGAAIREGLVAIRSRELVRECMTYVAGERGNTGADSGCHDDRVVAMAIALQARKTQAYIIRNFDVRALGSN